MAFQSNWRMCFACSGLFFGGHATKGACPGGATTQFLADPHVLGGSKHTFLVERDDGIPKPNTQPDWRYCWRCEGMFFIGNGKNGVCPAGGEHDPKPGCRASSTPPSSDGVLWMARSPRKGFIAHFRPPPPSLPHLPEFYGCPDVAHRVSSPDASIRAQSEAQRTCREAP
jgi:hypothetical protein